MTTKISKIGQDYHVCNQQQQNSNVYVQNDENRIGELMQEKGSLSEEKTNLNYDFSDDPNCKLVSLKEIMKTLFIASAGGSLAGGGVGAACGSLERALSVNYLTKAPKTGFKIGAVVGIVGAILGTIIGVKAENIARKERLNFANLNGYYIMNGNTMYSRQENIGANM